MRTKRIGLECWEKIRHAVMCPNMEGEVFGNSRSQGIQQGTSQTGEGINLKATVFIQNVTM